MKSGFWTQWGDLVFEIGKGGVDAAKLPRVHDLFYRHALVLKVGSEKIEVRNRLEKCASVRLQHALVLEMGSEKSDVENYLQKCGRVRLQHALVL